MKNRRGKPCPRPKKRESGIIQKSWLLYDWINDHFLWLLKNQCMKTHLRRAPLHITNPPLRPDAPPHAVGMKRISFNAGELSPELFQSADLNAFHRGASTLVNRNPPRWGPCAAAGAWPPSRRPGTTPAWPLHLLQFRQRALPHGNLRGCPARPLSEFRRRTRGGTRLHGQRTQPVHPD